MDNQQPSFHILTTQNECVKIWKKVQRPSPCWDLSIYNLSQQEYGASKGVGENPLNGNGVPLAGRAEGEDMVYSIQKCIGVLLKNKEVKYEKI